MTFVFAFLFFFTYLLTVFLSVTDGPSGIYVLVHFLTNNTLGGQHRTSTRYRQACGVTNFLSWSFSCWGTTRWLRLSLYISWVSEHCVTRVSSTSKRPLVYETPVARRAKRSIFGNIVKSNPYTMLVCLEFSICKPSHHLLCFLMCPAIHV